MYIVILSHVLATNLGPCKNMPCCIVILLHIWVTYLLPCRYSTAQMQCHIRLKAFSRIKCTMNGSQVGLLFYNTNSKSHIYSIFHGTRTCKQWQHCSAMFQVSYLETRDSTDITLETRIFGLHGFSILSRDIHNRKCDHKRDFYKRRHNGGASLDNVSKSDGRRLLHSSTL